MTSQSQIVHILFSSQILQNNPLNDPTERTLSVYLPAGYEEEKSRQYPVIWVLAPFASWGQKLFNVQAWDENIVQRADRLIASGEMTPAIMAFPDAFTRFGGSQYRNSTATGRYADYVIRELVPHVDETFRTLAEAGKRAVMGHSSGGYGALMLAMEYPEVFGAAASHSGDMFFETCYWLDIPGAVRGLEEAGGVAKFIETFDEQRDTNRDWWNALSMIAMSACYSPNPGSPTGFDLPFDILTGQIKNDIWERWQSLDPVRAAPSYFSELRNLRGLYFDCGNRDDFNLFLGARWLHRLLDENDVQHMYEEFPGGHGRIGWRYDISLSYLSKALTN